MTDKKIKLIAYSILYGPMAVCVLQFVYVATTLAEGEKIPNWSGNLMIFGGVGWYFLVVLSANIYGMWRKKDSDNRGERDE